MEWLLFKMLSWQCFKRVCEFNAYHEFIYIQINVTINYERIERVLHA